MEELVKKEQVKTIEEKIIEEPCEEFEKCARFNFLLIIYGYGMNEYLQTKYSANEIKINN